MENPRTDFTSLSADIAKTLADIKAAYSDGKISLPEVLSFIQDAVQLARDLAA